MSCPRLVNCFAYAGQFQFNAAGQARCEPPAVRSGLGSYAESLRLVDLGAGERDKLIVGVGEAIQSPSAAGCFRQQYPGALG